MTERDLRIAATWALNDMAEDIRLDVQKRMNVVFDRPTRWTLNSFEVVKANPTGLQAVVQQRAGSASRHYLRVEEEGGPRPQTGLEKLVSQKLAFAGIVQSIIPADNARLDAYGNWSSGEISQVLSDLKVQRDAHQNATEASRKRNRARGRYFVPKGGLTANAIYKRGAKGQIGVVAVISPKVPVYQQRLGLFDNAGRVFVAKMPGHLSRTLAKMMAKRFG
jgi:hypothetical protein